MTLAEILGIINRNLDSRNLKKPNIRKSALCKIILFIETTGNYLLNDQLILPNKRKEFELAYRKYKKSELNGAEKNVIKLIYDSLNTKSIKKLSAVNNTERNSNLSIASSIVELDISEIERNLMQRDFYSVNYLSKELIPDSPGLYCIKLRKDVVLPNKYGKIRTDGIIYIGKATKSLLKRLWEEDLNHKNHTTFFRSVGAILDYLLPKGSLSDESRNYVFNEEDTDAIRE